MRRLPRPEAGLACGSPQRRRVGDQPPGVRGGPALPTGPGRLRPFLPSKVPSGRLRVWSEGLTASQQEPWLLGGEEGAWPSRGEVAMGRVWVFWGSRNKAPWTDGQADGRGGLLVSIPEVEGPGVHRPLPTRASLPCQEAPPLVCPLRVTPLRCDGLFVRTQAVGSGSAPVTSSYQRASAATPPPHTVTFSGIGVRCGPNGPEAFLGSGPALCPACPPSTCTPCRPRRCSDSRHSASFLGSAVPTRPAA